MSKYVDTTAIVNVISNIYVNPNLLDDPNYTFNEEDFVEDFHRIVFGSIYNLHNLGAKEITDVSIQDYLSKRPKSLATFEVNKGVAYLQQLKSIAEPNTFKYYYDRMKKFTLLRMYNEKVGLDVKWIYDPDNIFDNKKKELQEDHLDNSSLTELADEINRKIDEIKIKYVDSYEDKLTNAGDDVDILLENLKKKPEIGRPMYGKFINTIVKGARLTKFYLRSAPTGVGKSRAMIADACYIGCDEIWDFETKSWKNTGEAQSTMYVSTELQKDECQTMMIAFLSGVDEDHIIMGEYEDDEWARVKYASGILKHGKIFIQTLPDFSLQDIENLIKSGIREYGTRYVFFDYLHTSLHILEEISKRSGGVKLREDNILFMIAIRMKDLCNEYGIFLLTSTQLNGSYVDAEELDQNLLRGAKAIADKIDAGWLLFDTTEKDKEALSTILTKKNYDVPDMKMVFYKNRRGRWKNVILWCKSNRSCCRIDPIFATKTNYEFIDMEDFVIRVKPAETQSAF